MQKSGGKDTLIFDVFYSKSTIINLFCLRNLLKYKHFVLLFGRSGFAVALSATTPQALAKGLMVAAVASSGRSAAPCAPKPPPLRCFRYNR